MRIIPIHTRQIGTTFLVPQTAIQVTVYPALLQLESLQTQEVKEIHFDLKGPVSKFEVTLDQKKERLEIVMHTADGYFSYLLYAKEDAVVFKALKAPLHLKFNGHAVETKIVYPLIQALVNPMVVKTQFFLGSMASKESTRVLEDLELKTLLPWFLALAVKLPSVDCKFGLNPYYQKQIEQKLTFEKGVKLIFNSFVQGFFSCFQKDLTFQNLPDLFEKKISKLEMLAVLKKELIDVFIQFDGKNLKILPRLPKAFHQGKICDLEIGDLTLSFSWSRGVIRDISLQTKKACSFTVEFPKTVKAMENFEGHHFTLEDSKFYFTFKANQKIIFNNFKK